MEKAENEKEKTMAKDKTENESTSSETKLFFSQLGMDPSTFNDDVFNIINLYLADSTDALESVLLEKFAPVNAGDKEKTVKAVDALYDILTESLDKNWLEFENYIQQNLFRIPEGLHIPSSEEDGLQGDAIVTGSSERERRLDAELDTLRQTVAQEQAEIASLRRELRAADNVQRYNRPARAMSSLIQEMAINKEPLERLQNLMDRAEVFKASRGHQSGGRAEEQNVDTTTAKMQSLTVGEMERDLKFVNEKQEIIQK